MLAAFGGVVALAEAKTLEWRSEVALHDGGVIVARLRVQVVPGEPFKSMDGAKRFTFAHPATGQPIIWENAGKIGSRLTPILLEVDARRLWLVAMPQSVSDYNGFDCPTPPYIVFRNDGEAWVRVPLRELPTRFWKANLLGFTDENLIRESKGYVTAAQVEAWFDDLRRRADTNHYGRIDRRIRNPVGLGCSHATDRVYGEGSYKKWSGMDTWLNLPEGEARKLLEMGGRP